MIEGAARVMFEPMSASIKPVKSGKLRALAVTTRATRCEVPLPDIPALAEAVSGYEASAVTGIGARREHSRPTSSIGSTRRSMRPSPIRR